MMLRNVSVSRMTQVGLRAGLLILFVGGLLATTTACSWFKRGGESDMIVNPPADVAAQTAAPAASPDVTPADSPKEGPRPGDILPFPELKTIYFDFDRSEIRPDQLVNVEGNLKYLLENLDAKVVIDGHCDERGTVEYNFSLGERRAKAVADYYTKNGVASERIIPRSMGEEEPVALGHDEAAYSQNRRCEFKRMY